MNLLFVIHYPTFGGPHNQALRLNQPLRERGWNTHVLLPSEQGNAVERLRDGGVNVIQTPLHRARNKRDPRFHIGYAAGFPFEIDRLRRLMREHKIDLVLVGGLINPHAGIAARLEKVPVVWQILEMSTPRSIWRLLRPIVSWSAASLMFAGRAPVDRYMAERPLEKPSFVFYPPVDTVRFRPSEVSRAKIRRELSIPDGVPVVGSVANMNPEKGIEYFVRSAALIHKSVPNCRFLLVGANYSSHREYTDQIQHELKLSGIPDEHFIYAGERTNVEEFYAAMDVKLLTSVSEAAPTTVMEAMSCGVPVVGTNVGSVADLIDPASTGFVVPSRDPEAIADATLEIVRNGELHARMSDAARRRATDLFDVQACADIHVDAFGSAMLVQNRASSPQHDEVRV